MWPFTRRRTRESTPLPEAGPSTAAVPEAFERLVDALLEQRQILLFGEINDDQASRIIQQLLFLQYESRTDPITIEIFDSPGGSLAACMAIIETMRSIDCPIHTLARSHAAGSAAFIFASGTPGQRVASPEARFTITQISYVGPNPGGQLDERDSEQITTLLADTTGRALEEIAEDLRLGRTLSASAAVAYGLADQLAVEPTGLLPPARQAELREADWESCDDPERLLEIIRHTASERKLRLFGVACCRNIWRLCRQPESRQLVELAEAHADGSIDSAEFVEAGRTARHPELFRHENELQRLAAIAFHGTIGTTPNPVRDWLYSQAVTTSRLAREAGRAASRPEADLQSNLVRCLFRSPDSSVAFDPRWRTDDVVELTRAIYQERAFERMHLLSDALMDAGCEDENMIGHCQGSGPHARGCWVLDLILDRS